MINALLQGWPAELESLLYGHPAVQEVCVHFRTRTRGVAKTHPSGYAYWLPGQQATEQGRITWCQANMSAYKVPQTGGFCRRQLPNSTGKDPLAQPARKQEWADC